MRWLIVGAIFVGLALAFLAWTLSSTPEVPAIKVADRSEQPSNEEPDPEPTEAPQVPSRPPAPAIDSPEAEEPDRPVAQPALPSPSGSSGSSGSGSAEDPALAPWRGQPPPRRRIRLRVAESRLSQGNYKGALESGLQLIEMYPEMTSGYKVTVTALCALGDLERARTILAKLDDKEKTVRAEIQKACTDLGATLLP